MVGPFPPVLGTSVTVAPIANPFPEIVSEPEVPFGREGGVIDVTVGVVTVKTAVPIAVPPSPLVSVTSRVPVVAVPAIVMFAVSWLALLYVVELTVMPVPENDVASPAPLTKLVPLTVTFWFVAP